uniref:Secreted protein n=1 Tax=Nicotiana tabacum TaxID=4097 RepID=A0A1S3YPF1_TOBAC|nr:PREDICTED: uncharacterized protein LOC107778269 [Nicotiana tabacum]
MMLIAITVFTQLLLLLTQLLLLQFSSLPPAAAASLFNFKPSRCLVQLLPHRSWLKVHHDSPAAHDNPSHGYPVTVIIHLQSRLIVVARSLFDLLVYGLLKAIKVHN